MMPDPMIRFKNEGYRELRERFISLDRKMRRTIATKAVRAGNRTMIAALRSHVPIASRAAYKAIGGKIKTYRNSNVTVGIVGERFESRRGAEKKKKSKWGGPHLHLIEYGTAERFQTGEKATRAGMPGVGAFGKFGINIRAAQAFTRIVAGETLGMSKRSKTLAARLGARRATAIMRAVRQGRSTGRVVAKPFFEKAFRRAVKYVQEAQAQVMREEINRAWRAA